MTKNHFDSVLPPATIGILGGGQLGRMMALDGRKMGYRFVVLDPTPDCPTGQVADNQIVAPFTDLEAATELARQSDVVTYEFENVDAAVAGALEATTQVPQGSNLLAFTQHRVKEKSTLQSYELPVTPFVPISSLADLDVAIRELGDKLVIKTCRGGYDGKGQWMVNSKSDLDQHLATWEAILAEGNDNSLANPLDAPLIAEAFIPFVGELSVVVGRNQNGDVQAFPPSENIHLHHILHLSIVPARFDSSISDKAVHLAIELAEKINLVGLVAVEFFVGQNGELFINELAPRPHNSGHYTMDACATSQFEQHIRAVTNLPLGDVSLLTPVVMVNVLGQHLDAVLSKMPNLPRNVKVHLYGKHEAKVGRKMGHLNVLCDNVEDALSWIEEQGIW